MDPTTFGKAPAAVSLAAILDELPEDRRRGARSRAATILGDARATARAVVAIEDRRTALYLLDLARHDFGCKIEKTSLTLKVQTFLCNVVASVFRDATKTMKSRSRARRSARRAGAPVGVDESQFDPRAPAAIVVQPGDRCSCGRAIDSRDDFYAHIQSCPNRED